MPGRKMLDALCRAIEEKGGEDYIFEQLSDGIPVGKIAAEFNVSRRMIYRWRDLKGFEHRAALWAEALKLSGEAHAEKGLEALEAPMQAPSDVQLAGHKSKYRQWLAGHRDREAFGDKGIELNFSIGQIHLAAVQESKNLLPVQEAEVLAIEDEQEAGSVEALAPPVDVAPSASEPDGLPAELSELL
ncbi:MAG: hypothetical protein AB7R40_23300 [Nitrospiraceae bacterium]